MRDFRSLLADVPCWDRTTEELFRAHGEPLQDCALQNREELIGLCEFLEEHEVRSFLEIGVWTGRTLSALHAVFRFERVAACDHGWARRWGLPVVLPPETHVFAGDSESDEYLGWREGLGAIDFVLIDANHAYHAVRRDFERNLAFPHRFLALHDITGCRRATSGVRRLWEEISHPGVLPGRGFEIVRPHRELGLDHSTMGIGIWAAAATP
jgi:Methyltransferase domain